MRFFQHITPYAVDYSAESLPPHKLSNHYFSGAGVLTLQRF
jgi:hypothetical protein